MHFLRRKVLVDSMEKITVPCVIEVLPREGSIRAIRIIVFFLGLDALTFVLNTRLYI